MNDSDKFTKIEDPETSNFKYQQITFYGKLYLMNNDQIRLDIVKRGNRFNLINRHVL